MRNNPINEALRCELDTIFSFLKAKKPPPIRPLTLRSVVTECVKQSFIFGISVYAATGYFGPAKKYADRLLQLMNINNPSLKTGLGIFLGLADASTNTMLSSYIFLELVNNALKKRTQHHKFLVGEETRYKTIKNNPLFFFAVIFGLFCTIPIGYITYVDEDSLIQGILVGIANFPMSFEGVNTFSNRVFPYNRCASKQVKSIKKAQRIFADVLEYSFVRFLQRSEAEIDSTLARFQGRQDINYINFILELGYDFEKVESDSFVYRRCSESSSFRYSLVLSLMFLMVIPQLGYVVECWSAGLAFDDSNIALAVVAVIISGVIYSGLTMESAAELGSHVGDGQKTMPMLLAPRFRSIAVKCIFAIGIFSGATLARTNYENFYQEDTAIFMMPLYASLLMEIFGCLSDACSNVYYSLSFVDYVISQWFFFRSKDDSKRSLVLLEEGVMNTASLFRNMTPQNFQHTLQSGYITPRLFHKILCDNKMDEEEIDDVFDSCSGNNEEKRNYINEGTTYGTFFDV